MMLKSSAAAAALFLAAVGCVRAQAPQGASAQGGAQASAQLEPLEVVTARGPVRFQVEIADDDAERERGLMFRQHLADNRGMLFEFERPSVQSFWMKNTLIPLDMIFIGPDGRIVSISKMAKPQTLDARTSSGPATGVLEVRGGLADKDGIKPGDMVRHPFFSQPTAH